MLGECSGLASVLLPSALALSLMLVGLCFSLAPELVLTFVLSSGVACALLLMFAKSSGIASAVSLMTFGLDSNVAGALGVAGSTCIVCCGFNGALGVAGSGVAPVSSCGIEREGLQHNS